ncbi:MAG: tetratricopeptide repeat protein [Elusimicrobia bacterium]|nr:tetratricopeptide repeat protein [Candidatus Liberimonas magnetica]
MRLKKAGLILLGILASMILLEIGMRLGGFIYNSRQEIRNREELKKKQVYRILCLGESTTQEQYPKYLEEVLNNRDIGIKFSVIDKGRFGTNTNFIAAKLEEDLDKYRPDMVITMMGVNDARDDIIFEYADDGRRSLIKSIKIYKLARLLRLHIKSKIEELKMGKGRIKQNIIEIVKELNSKKRIERAGKEGRNNITKTSSDNGVIYAEKGDDYRNKQEYEKAEEMYKRAIELNPDYDQEYFGLGHCYEVAGRYEEAEEMYEKALKLNPKSLWNNKDLGFFYLNLKRFEEAEEMFKKAIEIYPKNAQVYSDLGNCYKVEGKYEEAEKEYKKAETMFQKVLLANPKEEEACFGLGDCYMDTARYKEAEEIYKRAIQLNLNFYKGYARLGECYYHMRKYKKSEEMYKRAIVLNPDYYKSYLGLGECFDTTQKCKEAEKIYKRAIEVDSKKYQGYFYLGNCYKDQGRYEEAKEELKKSIEINPNNKMTHVRLYETYKAQKKYKESMEILNRIMALEKNSQGRYKVTDDKINIVIKKLNNEGQINSQYFGVATIYNYKRLRKILKKRGVKYVCVQYPMREVDDLKLIFKEEKDIIFVDNKRVFKEAINKQGYNEYFRDRIDEKFGHCTIKGNKLLAENIADTIIREVLNK